MGLPPMSTSVNMKDARGKFARQKLEEDHVRHEGGEGVPGLQEYAPLYPVPVQQALEARMF